MVSPVDQYTKELCSQFRYVPTWTPGTFVRLGDIGVLEGRAFVPRSTLRSVGIRFKVVTDKTRETMDYASQGVVGIRVKVSGKPALFAPALALAQAGIAVKFGRENGVLLHVEGCKANRIADQFALDRAIRGLWNKGIWQKEWVVITEVVAAKKALILLSSTKDATVQLQASGSIPLATGLGALKGSFAVVASQGMHTAFVDTGGLTPFFRACQIRQGLFSSPIVQVEDRVMVGDLGRDVPAGSVPGKRKAGALRSGTFELPESALSEDFDLPSRTIKIRGASALDKGAATLLDRPILPLDEPILEEIDHF